jgi:alkaline phosphatase
VDENKRAPGISLANMVKRALECLTIKNPKGFFLIVEAGRIDHALHARLIPTALRETLELDETVAATLRYLKSQSLVDDTLVLVTADHDTGGLAINGPYYGNDKSYWTKTPSGETKMMQIQHYSKKGPSFNSLKLSTDQNEVKDLPNSTHTGVDVDLYATGPGSQLVQGTIENTEIFQIMKKAYGF